MKKGILIFDICSSTEILETLVNSNHEAEYINLIRKMDTCLQILSQYFSFKNYKFLGDGFILVINPDIKTEDVVYLSFIINKIGNYLLNDITDNYIQISLKRKGFTFGYDIGDVSDFHVSNKLEFAGKPINLSCRLQGSLDKEEDAGCILFSLEARNNIESKAFKTIINKSDRERTFKNICGDKPIRCFFYNLENDYVLNTINPKPEKRLPPRIIKKEETEINVEDIFNNLDLSYFLQNSK